MARGDTNLPIDETLPILPEEEVYEVDIYGVGETTDAMGGIGGEANVPSRGLVNRTAWLKKVYNLLIVKVGDLTRFALKHGDKLNIFKVKAGEADDDAINKKQLTTAINSVIEDIPSQQDISGLVKKSGDTMNGALTNIKNGITNRGTWDGNDIILNAQWTDDEHRKYMFLNMYDDASRFRFYPRGGVSLDFDYSQNWWEISGAPLLTSFINYKAHSEPNGGNVRITDEHFGTDTNISLEKENIKCVRHGRKVDIKLTLTLESFSQTLPSYNDFTFVYDLQAKIRQTLGKAKDGTDYDVAVIIPSPALAYWYHKSPAQGSAMELFETWQVSGGKVKFYADSVIGRTSSSSYLSGDAKADAVNVQLYATVILNKD